MRIGVVVCTYNGADRLGTCLAALMAQTRPADVVVVVNDASTDTSADIAGRFPVRLVSHRANQGLPTARNTGAAALSGQVDIVAYTDDDCVPGPGWLEALETAWRRAPGTVTVLGGVVTAHSRDSYHRRLLAAAEPLVPVEAELISGSVMQRVRYYFAANAGAFHGRGAREVLAPVGANMSVALAALESVGGFALDARGALDEESLAARVRARYRRGSVWVDPAVVMNHEFAPELADSWRRSRTYGFASGRRWAKEGGLPSFLLGPFLLAGAFVSLAPFSLAGATLAVLTGPALLFRRHLRPDGVKRTLAGSIERFTFPWVLSALELRTNYGLVLGWARTRRDGRRSVR